MLEMTRDQLKQRVEELEKEHDLLVERSVGAMQIAEGEIDPTQSVSDECPTIAAVKELRTCYNQLKLLNAQLAAKVERLSKFVFNNRCQMHLQSVEILWGRLVDESPSTALTEFLKPVRDLLERLNSAGGLGFYRHEEIRKALALIDSFLPTETSNQKPK